MSIGQMPNWKAWLEDRKQHRAPVDRHFTEAIRWIQRFGGLRVLELGPGHSKDLGRQLLAGHADITLVQVDLKPELPDVVDLAPTWPTEAWASGRRLPFDDESFDAVLAREVLEHVEDLFTMLSEIHRVLKVGGRLWFSAPFIFPLHDYESGDYWRLSAKAWLWLFENWAFRSYVAEHRRELWDSWQYPISVVGWAER